MKIEVWSDIMCPWCYIGKRRFEAALERFDGEVEVEFRSFQLDPHAAPRAEGPLDASLASKFGISLERAQQMLAQTTQAAAAEGLEFDFEGARGGNTFDAHRVLHYAKSVGLQSALKERLMKAYFSDGIQFADPDNLVKLAVEVGLEEAEIRRVLEDDSFAEAVRTDLARARDIGVRGVPFYLIDGEVGVTGAQPPQTFLNALNYAQTANLSAGEACADGLCDIPDA